MSASRIDPAAWNDGRGFLQGEVYLASDKYVSEALKAAFGLDVKKERPVVVLQNDRLNSVPQIPVILVAPVTSRPRILENDYPLKADGALLHQDSVIQLSLIQPIPKRALLKRIGKLKDADLQGIKDRLRRKFAL